MTPLRSPLSGVGRALRQAGAVAAVLLAAAAVVAAVGAGLYAGAAPADRAALARLVGEQRSVLAVAALLVGVLATLLVGAATRRYVELPRRLAADARLVAAANPEHRARVVGPAALRELAQAVNELAQRYDAGRHDVAEQVAAAAGDLEAERNRLAALMGQLSIAVLVCAPDGRILLYNRAAGDLLGGADGGVGLGRSVFEVLDRGLVVHGLERIDTGSDGYEGVTERAGTLVRVRLARVPADDERAGGFVLVCEDSTRTGRAAARRTELLRGTGERLRGGAAAVGAAAQNLLDYPDMPAGQRARFAEVVVAEAESLGEAAARLLAEADGGGSESRWPLAEMSVRDLLAAVAAAVGTAAGTPAADGTAATPGPRVAPPVPECWLEVDSFSLVGGLAWLVGMLGERCGESTVELGAARHGEFVAVDVRWPGEPLPAGELGRWAAEPGAPDLAAVARRHGGELWEDAVEPLVRLLLPASAGAPTPRTPARRDAGPPAALYDFGLAELEAGPSEWDDVALSQLRYTVFDTETTGFSPADGDEIVSIGAVRIVGGRLLAAESFERLVDPGRAIPRSAVQVHGISTEMVRGAPRLDEMLPAFAEFARDSVLVGHNVAFDMAFLAAAQRRTRVVLAAPLLDTLLVDSVVHPGRELHSLEAMADRLGIDLVGRHTALGDALVTGEVFLRLLPLLDARGVHTLGQLRAAAGATVQARESDRRYGHPDRA